MLVIYAGMLVKSFLIHKKLHNFANSRIIFDNNNEKNNKTDEIIQQILTHYLKTTHYGKQTFQVYLCRCDGHWLSPWLCSVRE